MTTINKKVPMGGERIQNARRKRLRLSLSPAKLRGVLMGTFMPATPTQTLYVTIRRDELRQLKDERDQLRQQVAQLNMLLQQTRDGEKSLSA